MNEIRFENLTYQVPTIGQTSKNDVKTVLNSISGCFRSGELTAIMGPSGSGKSSLLNILTGFRKQGVSGKINVNGIPLSHANNLSKQCSYILQEDNLYANFTVQETMWLAASLKIRHLDADRQQKMIDIVLDTLHLRRTKQTMCEHLSGGQRKRLSVALELLDNRPILLLDEPTTGLDAFAAAYCIRLMRNLVLEGRTVVCTIHQPAASVYELFDQVYVLAGGQCVFQGSASNTVPFLLANGLPCPHYHNPADFIIEVAAGEYGDHNEHLSRSAMETRWCHSGLVAAPTRLAVADAPSIGSQASAQRPNGGLPPPSEWQRFGVLLRRCRTHCLRDWMMTYLKLIVHILTAVLFGMIYGDSGSNAAKSLQNLSLLFACNIYVWYTAVLPSVLTFPAEMEIVRKETFNSWYRLSTFYFAQLLVTLPLLVVFSVCFSTIVYAMTDQPHELDRFVRFVSVFVLIIIAGDGVGLIVGCIVDPINGTFLGSMISIFKIALSGFLAMPSQVSALVRIVMYFSTLSYSLEGTLLALYDRGRLDIVCPSDELYCHYISPAKIMNLIGFDTNNYDFDVFMLVVQTICIRIFAYYVMRARLQPKT